VEQDVMRFCPSCLRSIGGPDGPKLDDEGVYRCPCGLNFAAMPSVKEARLVAHRYGCEIKGCDRIDPYMVTDALWAQLALHQRSNLCLHHLEARLGRRLRIEDFTDKPINDPIRLGFLMGGRAMREHLTEET
jgi:hypothetical protein